MSSTFDKKLKNYLTLYKIPIGPNQLDPTVFYYSETDSIPRLLPAIQSQISKDLEFFAGDYPAHIKNYYLVGSALVPGNTNKSKPLCVLIVLNKNLMDVDIDGVRAERILNCAKQLSGKYATGTNRPIEYQITTREIEDDTYSKYRGVYNLSTNDWKRIPNGLTN